MAVLLYVPAVWAQNPGAGGPSPDLSSPTAVPIDGGASLLLLAGGALALRHFCRSTAASKQPDETTK